MKVYSKFLNNERTHLLVINMKVKVAQSCLALCDPMDSTVHGIPQARLLEWIAFPFSRVCGKELQFGVAQSWVQILALTPTMCDFGPAA